MLTHAIREAQLPPAEPDVPAWMLDACDSLVWLDEPAPGLVRPSVGSDPSTRRNRRLRHTAKGLVV